MSKSIAGCLLAICLCLSLASCAMAPDEELDLTAEEEATPPELEASAVETAACQFSQQCEPCEAPWVTQTIQRTIDDCGAHYPLWELKWYCALCE